MKRLNLLLFALVLVAAGLSLLAGKVWVPPQLWLAGDLPARIIFDLRLPRTVLGLAIGAGLGVSGAVMQGYLRNPLADPGLFGVSSSAALGAVISLYFGTAAMAYMLPLSALAGAALGMAVLALLAGRSASLIVFTLAGIILSSLTGALTALFISLSPTPFAMSEIVIWLNGALTDRSWDDVVLAVPLMAVGAVMLAFTGGALDALTLGEDAARSLGVDMRRLQILVVLGVGMCVGASVASAGVIGFVGLMVPHLVRPLVRNKPSAILLPSALAGALLLVVADSLVRIAPMASELRLGIAMALLGAPFFLMLMLKLRRGLA